MIWKFVHFLKNIGRADCNIPCWNSISVKFNGNWPFAARHSLKEDKQTKNYHFKLGGRPFNSWVGGGGGRGEWVILKKNFLQAKKLHAAQCNRKLMGKKGKKNILPTRLLEKKNSWWPEITPRSAFYVSSLFVLSQWVPYSPSWRFCNTWMTILKVPIQFQLNFDSMVVFTLGC